ncbi:hypothetical protein [Petrimonas sp.]|uniref:hypothetical protein n=1 Tax=Petrimonas sp. TaxID=2023866 RepID=UPI003F519B62
MKTKIIIFVTILFFLLAVLGCEKEEILPPHQAQGVVMARTDGCYGGGIYIEVSNPKGIGKEGSFPGGDFPSLMKDYKNAIKVPYFHRVNLPEELEKNGTWLHFEYREITEEDIKQRLFDPLFIPKICPMHIGPPPATSLVITKIISHKP